MIFVGPRFPTRLPRERQFGGQVDHSPPLDKLGVEFSIHHSPPLTSPVVLGIAGTAKNTGKTTALNALLEEAHVRRVAVAVTSIGYDGESVDNVTGLPKPRIVLQPGTVATTSVACLPGTGYEMVEETEWSTALGRVLIVRCIEAAPIVLAGPSTRRDLAAIVERMRGLGPSLTLIDGALNRLAPMSVASALVLATGAARTDDLSLLARETAAIESIFSLPAVSNEAATPAVDITLPFAAMSDIAGAIGKHGGRAVRLTFRAPVSLALLRALVKHDVTRMNVKEIGFLDPVLALLSSDPIEMARVIGLLHDNGCALTVEHPMALAAVTINPFLPRYEHHGYVSDSVPAADLRRAVQSAVRSKVVDVVQDGRAVLWEALEPFLKSCAGL